MNLRNKKLLFSLAFILIAFVRLFGVSKFPASLYWEEAALGYDAYSILETGKDFHGAKLPVVAFKSFGDYKPSGYFYFTALSEKFLSPTPLAVRLPSVLAGLSIILLTFLISKEIFKNHSQKKLISGIAAVLIGFSPWAFQFSRAGFEANLATAFSVAAIYFLIKSLSSKKFLYYSVPFFTLSLYTYHSARVFVPIFLVFYLLLFLKSIIKNFKHFILAGLIGLALIIPIVSNLNSPEVQHRFQETSAFTDIAPIEAINQQRADHNNSILSRLIYHRYWFYLKTITQKTFSHLEPNYLFLTGDQNPRHSTQESGIFYPLDAIFLTLGVYFIFKSKKPLLMLLPFWWLAGILPATITKTTPHALRTLLSLPAPQIIAAFGVVKLVSSFKKHQKIITTVLVLIYSVFIFRHFYNYFTVYPKNYSSSWQYGYKDLMTYIGQNKDSYDQVFITQKLGRPSMYYFFYNQIDPALVQAEEGTSKKDQGERLEFENIVFELPQQILPNSILVTTTLEPDRDILHIVKDLSENPVFYVYKN